MPIDEDLELATTDQLVSELLRRSTFCGVVVRSELKGEWKGTKDFKFGYSGLDKEAAAGLMLYVGQHLVANG